MESTEVFSQRSVSKLTKLLESRYCLLNIYKERQILINLNMKLQIKLHLFIELSKQNCCESSVFLQALSKVSFFTIVTRQIKGKQEKYLSIGYRNLNKIVITTGLNAKEIQYLLHGYLRFMRKQKDFKNIDANYKIIGINDFWALIENQSQNGAQNMQRFFRTKKKDMEDKLEGKMIMKAKKIRIIMLQNNLLEVILQIFNQFQSQKFTNSIHLTLSGINPCRNHQEQTISYQFNHHQHSPYQINLSSQNICPQIPYQRGTIQLNTKKMKKVVEFIDFYAETQQGQSYKLLKVNGKISKKVKQEDQLTQTTASVNEQFNQLKLQDDIIQNERPLMKENEEVNYKVYESQQKFVFEEVV